MSWSRAIASSFGSVQKLWMKNVVPNRNTAIASADRSAQIPAMIPIPPDDHHARYEDRGRRNGSS
jgi:hypothetical protein